MHPNARLIESFYHAFQKGDAEAMAACYAPDVTFSDPVFQHLQGVAAGDMWRMLLSRSVDLKLVFDGVEADAQSGKAHWVATYTFSQTGRKVVNDIRANFTFRDGKIVRHSDQFDLWKWSRQALGAKGALLGWSPVVKGAIRKQAAKGLALYQQKKNA
jgi:ketosteroid isomerase-like protein